MNRKYSFFAIFSFSVTLCACSSVASIFGKGDPPPQVHSLGNEIVVLNPTTSYEWAVQSYEAGRYSEARERFEDLERDITSVSGFFLLPFYLGRIYFHESEFERSVSKLEHFLKKIPESDFDQEARLTLLFAYVSLRRWDDAVLQAAETSKKSLYTGNRILLQLLWSEALMEQGELVGAEQILREAQATLTQIPAGSRVAQGPSGFSENLEERAVWLQAKLASSHCKFLPAMSKPRSQSIKTRMDRWYSKKVQCACDVIFTTLPNLGRLEPEWSSAISTTLLELLADVESAPDQLVTQGKIPSIEMAKEGARDTYRKHFYRLLEFFRNLSATTPGYEQRVQMQSRLTARVEQILQKIAIEGSKADRTL